MEALPRSEVSFRRSGSSGLVWDDKLLSGELKPSSNPKDDEEREKKEQQRAEPRPYKSVEVEPTIDPPSPKISGCCGSLFKENHHHRRRRRRRRRRRTQENQSHPLIIFL
ncbi:hypothetical protein OSB04_021226 [Centaurea solstitialis]|uniref:MAPK kinase substrate protein n=1 Tax=Centaurea solstitialis TaxID=347529 RepID=A0AA38SU49_9ASTR|nr:hypothetical protein OSB04_021226 [Centaurea solstitialis]